MNTRFPLIRLVVAASPVVFLSGLAVQQSLRGQAGTPSTPAKGPEQAPAATSRAWTLDEALAQLTLNPKDAYLQYVALQLASRQKRLDKVADEVRKLVEGEASQEGNPADQQGANRGRHVDLFSIFTGALAVQESLQLDTMRGSSPGSAPVRESPSKAAETAKEPKQGESNRHAVIDKRHADRVPVARLRGPTVQSHPWEKLLGGKTPEVSPLARYVPEDHYFIEFRSLNKLLQALEVSDQWGTHLFNQAVREARTQKVGDRLKRQLALETDPVSRPFYDQVVREVAITGSDLFLREGSDVTVLFRLKQPDIFRARADGLLANAQKARPDARRTAAAYRGIDYVHLATPDREVSVFAAYPAPELHVRSNSKAAFERVLDAVRSKRGDGKAVRALGTSKEFAYIRTLLPRGAREEDGFLYLSDPFIRHMVGPQLKLTERRRVLCYNHLRMIGHAALLYRTEHGHAPKSLQQLVQARCAPEGFGQGKLACPDGGGYSLSADGSAGVCSHHGQAHFLTPCCEIPVGQATGEEAAEYQAFVKDYNTYWKTYFDPIAVRIQITPERFRLETIVLPLIQNSVYSGLAQVLGGKPEPLDALPVPKGNIFSVALRWNREELLKLAEAAGKAATKKEAGKKAEETRKETGTSELASTLKGVGFSERDAEALTQDALVFLQEGVGNQLGLHLYDASPMFDLNLPMALAMAMGSFNGSEKEVDPSAVFSYGGLGFLAGAFNSPVYLSVPVRDERVTDRFLKNLDKLLAVLVRKFGGRQGFMGFKPDFYRLRHQEDQAIRCGAVGFGPVKLRLFWGRIGKGLYLASKQSVLDDLAAAENERVRSGPAEAPGHGGPVGHGMLRVRAEHWDQVLPGYRLSWAENNREACLNNLGPLSSVARALAGRRADPDFSTRGGAEAQRRADKLYGVHFFCPDGGHYLLSADGKTCTCSVHGSALAPRQSKAPEGDSDPAKLLRGFAGLTATLTFLEDGLHAVVSIDRKEHGR